MIVTFVSQCEKNALSKTRQVLDAFANRIGDKTWQTVITEEGLDAVQRLLRKSASKNTAVACHRNRGYSRSELAWIVGNRKKFSAEGYVPVNTTQAESQEYEDHWGYLEVIKALTALAGLFHDWGKATACFQAKLAASCDGPGSKGRKKQGDPLRHEWISCLLLQALLSSTGTQNDQEKHTQEKPDQVWLSQLAAGEIDETRLKNNLQAGDQQSPLKGLPPAASLIAWLVLSHHRLPLPDEEQKKSGIKAFLPRDFQHLLGQIKADFGYQNKYDLKDYEARLPTCFEFPEGLLSQSAPWLKQLKKWAAKLQQCLPELEEALQNGSWRVILHHARLSLMLADHFYSSQAADSEWHKQSQLPLYANTQTLSEGEQKTTQLKQKLDEHLVYVAKNALQIACLLPAFETQLKPAQDLQKLKKHHPDFAWQDKAVKAIKSWRSQQLQPHAMAQTGFFAVNMASTGCGKTIANAKVMRALSADYESLRYVLALGLRTLTLQTGDEYRERVGLDNGQMAVMIGSQAVLELHKLARKTFQDEEAEQLAEAGAESSENLLANELDYEAPIPEERLSTLFAARKAGPRQQAISKKNQQFLYAPVLVCTIDHLMAATETKRGGRYILPCLRLMSSDLVIDEIDDFDGSDLIAIGRLIHLAGMLGRKVMISSATVPPDLAEGYFNAYREGWLLYCKFRKFRPQIGCAWIDEFKTQLQTFNTSDTATSLQDYRNCHQQFVNQRASKLLNPSKTPIRRRGVIVDCTGLSPLKKQVDAAGRETLENQYFEAMRQEMVKQHYFHHTLDPVSGKRVSFGVVRMANVDPCIRLARYLLQAAWEPDLAPKIMTYHSRQVLLLRSAQEQHLDQVLKRKEKPGELPQAFAHPLIRQHLNTSAAEDVLFIVVATPVEEIGRDHDFDWAVLEPSSYRSLIQLAGRVLRHRKISVESANIALMQYSLKALKGHEIAYHRPGYESAETEFKLITHDLKLLLEGTEIEKGIQALPRIQKNQPLLPQQRLADLEHYVMQQLLACYQAKGPHKLQGWLSQDWWLTALPQSLQPFRQNNNSLRLYYVKEKDDFYFMERSDRGEFVKRQGAYQIEAAPTEALAEYQERLWLDRNYAELLEQVADKQDITQTRASQLYGEINLPVYGASADLLNAHYLYSDQFGLHNTRNV